MRLLAFIVGLLAAVGVVLFIAIASNPPKQEDGFWIIVGEVPVWVATTREAAKK